MSVPELEAFEPSEGKKPAFRLVTDDSASASAAFDVNSVDQRLAQSSGLLPELPLAKANLPVEQTASAHKNLPVPFGDFHPLSSLLCRTQKTENRGDKTWWLYSEFCKNLVNMESGLGQLAINAETQQLEQWCKIQNQLGLRKNCQSIRVTVPFFTHRPPIYNKAKDQIIGFGPGRGNEVYYGEVPVILPATDQALARQGCSTKLGWQFLGRSCKDGDAEIGKVSTYGGGRQEFFGQLDKRLSQQEQVLGQNKGELAFFFPGFSTNFRNSLVMAAVAQRDWGVPVVLDSWPSRDKFGPIAYNADEWSISTNYRQVTRPVLKESARRYGPGNLSLIGFSMGSRPVTSFALDCAAEYDRSGLQQERLNRVIEAEADQPAEAFKGDLEQIAKGAKDVTLYVSDEHSKGADVALKVSKKYHGGEQPLGLAGPELYSLLPPAIDNVRSIVVNEINKPPFYHDDHDQVMATYAKYGAEGLREKLKYCLEAMGPPKRFLDENQTLQRYFWLRKKCESGDAI
jgi:hypothetical protein